jgi:hypothetical protein
MWIPLKKISYLYTTSKSIFSNQNKIKHTFQNHYQNYPNFLKLLVLNDFGFLCRQALVLLELLVSCLQDGVTQTYL